MDAVLAYPTEYDLSCESDGNVSSALALDAPVACQAGGQSSRESEGLASNPAHPGVLTPSVLEDVLACPAGRQSSDISDGLGSDAGSDYDTQTPVQDNPT